MGMLSALQSPNSPVISAPTPRHPHPAASWAGSPSSWALAPWASSGCSSGSRWSRRRSSRRGRRAGRPPPPPSPRARCACRTCRGARLRAAAASGRSWRRSRPCRWATCWPSRGCPPFTTRWGLASAWGAERAGSQAGAGDPSAATAGLVGLLVARCSGARQPPPGVLPMPSNPACLPLRASCIRPPSQPSPARPLPGPHPLAGVRRGRGLLLPPLRAALCGHRAGHQRGRVDRRRPDQQQGGWVWCGGGGREGFSFDQFS